MAKRLIECVPNFSEGRDPEVIRQLTQTIVGVKDVQLLDVDPGKDTNRTVVTFVGEPEQVLEAAFLAIQKASQIIDMRHHKGAHPRFGATDVCPFVPLSNVTMDECVTYAQRLGKRVGEELGISVYLYENAATEEKRRSLSSVREGEYEGLREKIARKEWKPDFGPTVLNERAGAIAIGARGFLVAFNVNLNTTSTRRANAIAFDVREQGRMTEKDGKNVKVPGTLKKVKAIGWFIKEYGIAQVSMNLTDISVTPVHVAFDEVDRCARERGVRVTGTELVGLIPLQALLDVGKHYLKKQQRSLGIPESEIIKIAVESLGLAQLKPFNPNEKVIEYLLETRENDPSKKALVSQSITKFSEETASESPAPGGGSIAAYMGTLAAALGTMVANLSSHKRGWDDKWEFYSIWAERGERLRAALLAQVDADTIAFNKIMDSFALPKGNAEEQAAREKQIEEATRNAVEVPFGVMKLSLEVMEVVREMAISGNANSVTDAGVGALAARSAVLGAFLNVKVNAQSLKDREYAIIKVGEGEEMKRKAIEREEEILRIVEEKIASL